MVTERGRPVAKLVPIERPDIPPRIAALIASGKATWCGQKPPPFDPPPMAPGDQTIAEMIAEDRR